MELGRFSDSVPAGPDERRTPNDAATDSILARRLTEDANWSVLHGVLDPLFPGIRVLDPAPAPVAGMWPGFPIWADGDGLVIDLTVQVAEPRTSLRTVPHRAPAPPEPVDWAPIKESAPHRLPAPGDRRVAGRPVLETEPYAPFGPGARQNGGTFERLGGGGVWALGGAGEESGLVIVTRLAELGARVVDGQVVWRHACAVVSSALADPRRPLSINRARRVLRALRVVVVVDPVLRLGLCVVVSPDGTARCPLAFTIDPGGSGLRFYGP